jgi:hypothetical protein
MRTPTGFIVYKCEYAVSLLITLITFVCLLSRLSSATKIPRPFLKMISRRRMRRGLFGYGRRIGYDAFNVWNTHYNACSVVWRCSATVWDASRFMFKTKWIAFLLSDVVDEHRFVFQLFSILFLCLAILSLLSSLSSKKPTLTFIQITYLYHLIIV